MGYGKGKGKHGYMGERRDRVWGACTQGKLIMM